MWTKGRSGCSGEIRRFSGVWIVAYDGRMSRVCESWSLGDLTEMSGEDMERLLGFYKLDTVPSLKSIRGEEQDKETPFVFDGSFGWW